MDDWETSSPNDVPEEIIVNGKEQKMKAELCPVCKGSGKLGDLWCKCHGCKGRGWIKVGGDVDTQNYPFYEPNPWAGYPYFHTDCRASNTG